MTTELSILNNEIADARKMVVREKSLRLDDSLYSKELAPHYMQLASQLSKSSMVPKAYQGKPQDLFVAMAMGYQIGLSVEQAVQAIAVINGKPCLWGDDMLALCMAHPDFEDIEEHPIRKNDKEDTVIGYVCTIRRKGMKPHTSNFTLDMAKKAGLLSKTGPWTQYPERMLQLRARSFALRDKFPDALKGIKSREEVEDYVEAEFKVVDDKSSRTEFLKKDLLTRRGENVDVKTHIEDKVPGVENQEDSKQTEQVHGDKSLGDSPTEEDQTTEQAIPNTAATPLQITTIQKLLKEKQFSEERLIKALNYYEVDGLGALNVDCADHFIEQLNKI